MGQDKSDPLQEARDLLEAGRNREASALLARFLRQNPGHERGWHMLSYALVDPDQQAYALQKVLEINPRNRVARSSLTGLQSESPQTPSAPEPGPRPDTEMPTASPAATLARDKLPGAASLPGYVGPTSSVPPPARQRSQLSRFAQQAVTSPSLVAGSVLILLFLAVAIAAPLIAPPQGDVPSLIPRDGYGSVPQPPSRDHPLGTMEAQNDVLYGLVWGTRAAFRLGLIITLGRAVIGLLIGLVSGHFGGVLDSLLMRLTDGFLAYPIMAVVMVTVALFGFELVEMPNGTRYPWPNGPRTEAVIILTMIAFGWMSYARLIRGNILSQREKEYMEAARSIGVPNQRLVFRHLLPNSTHGLLVLIAADIGMMVVWMAAFNFVGLIRGQKTMMVADWGQMLSFARGWIVGPMTNPLAYWYTFIPVTAAIVLFSMGWNLIGDGLRDVFDPHLQKGPIRPSL